MSELQPLVEQALESGLTYVSHSDLPGITRKRAGSGFVYLAPDGTRIADKATLSRIRKLAIPPAYTDVWICTLENGHIQATGRDARGRKQYRYHDLWTQLSKENKFGRMLEFGRALPNIRKRVDVDLRRHGVPKEKACASVVWLLENSLIRVGNEEYARENKSYGLTTMRSRHATIGQSHIEFKFRGKRGIEHLVRVSDRRIARILRQISELPGQELFCYLDDSGQVRTIGSADINAYLRETTGSDFTAKDFRTWAATALALDDLCNAASLAGTRAAQKAVRDTLARVARQLGNTPAICRKSYVHPGIVQAYLEGKLLEVAGSRRNIEKCLTRFLQAQPHGQNWGG